MGATRLGLLAGSVTLLVAACTSAAGSPAAPATSSPEARSLSLPAASYRLYIHDGFGRSSQPLRVIDAATGRVDRELPFGIPAPDWSRVYTVVSSNELTTLRVLDPVSGKVLRETVMGGRYFLSAGQPGTLPLSLSPDGHWLVLENTTPDKQGVISKTGYQVVDTTFASPPRRLEVDGWMPLHAVSNDGAHLYVNEYLGQRPARIRNRIRRVDMNLARLDPQFTLDRSVDQNGMAGGWHSPVTSPDGRYLYSIYADYNGYADQDQIATVYTLDLNTGTTSAVDLPWSNRANWEAQPYWQLTLTPDGCTLYALNGALGLIAELDAREHRILRTATLQLPPRGRKAFHLFSDAEAKVPLTGGALLSSDGETIFALSLKGLITVDTRKLTIRSYLRHRSFNSMALSPDGAWLYAVSAQEANVVQIDPRTVGIIADVRGLAGPMTLFRVEAVSR